MLRDGATVHVRPIRREDEERLLTFYRTLSKDSRALRFFLSPSDTFLEEEAKREVAVDYAQSFGLVATTGVEERFVGYAFYALDTGDRAEVALAIADDYQGRGLGTILLGQIAEIAGTNGIHVFEAVVAPENHRMLDVLRESGFPVEVRAGAGEIQVTFPTSLTAEARERFEQRERIASINALEAFFAPRAVAVIGASRQRGTIGGEIFHNLLSYQFTGAVYPVNPAADVVQCVPAYATVEEIPGPVDLAIIVVPAAEVVRVAEQCGRKGVRALVVISAGFAETGEEGRARQAELLGVCRQTGMRLIGPNCMGIVNTDPTVHLDATFAPQAPPAGRVGFLSQSGALGLAIIDLAHSLGLGISTFVSVGNKADISGNDLLSYWEADPRTDVILLYLESFGNPRKFSQIARRVGRRKPIAVVKSGRSPAGTRASLSHTGALLAASDITADALFRQAGVIRTDTLEELFDVASLLAHQPPPRGRRVGIVTNAGGPAILCADACAAEGLEVPVLAAEAQAQLRQLLPPQASVVNPVDMIASASAKQYREAMRIVASDPQVNALIVIFIPPLVTRAEEVACAIVEGVRDLPRRIPVLTVFMSAHGVPRELAAPDVQVPSYAFPEAAAKALARAAWYGQWRERPAPSPTRLAALDRDEAAALVAAALRHGEEWLGPDEVSRLFSCYGLPLVEQRVVTGPREAAVAAEELGGEVALKASAPGIVHKTEVGAVRLQLRGADAVQAAAEEMRNRLMTQGYRPTQFVVQRMVPEGVEMIVGVVHDSHFGPVVACGAGGTLAELIRDVSVRLTPLTPDDATEMIHELKTFPLLTGFRGQPPGDIPALAEILLRVSALAEDLPEIAELDCNPIRVHAKGAVVVDARVRVAPCDLPPLLGRRSGPFR